MMSYSKGLKCYTKVSVITLESPKINHSRFDSIYNPSITCHPCRSPDNGAEALFAFVVDEAVAVAATPVNATMLPPTLVLVNVKCVCEAGTLENPFHTGVPAPCATETPVTIGVVSFWALTYHPPSVPNRSGIDRVTHPF